MSIKSRQNSQTHHQIPRRNHRHRLHAAAISAVACADAPCAGAESDGRNRWIGAVHDCRFMFGGAEAAAAVAQ